MLQKQMSEMQKYIQTMEEKVSADIIKAKELRDQLSEVTREGTELDAEIRKYKRRGANQPTQETNQPVPPPPLKV